MRLVLLTFLGLSSFTSGFTAPFGTTVTRPQVSLASTVEEETASVPLVVAGTNIELTEALVGYVDKRIGGNLNKLSSNGAIRECDVHLSVNKNPKVRIYLILKFMSGDCMGCGFDRGI